LSLYPHDGSKVEADDGSKCASKVDYCVVQKMRSLKICEKVEAVDGSKYKNGTTIVAVSMVKRQILLKPLCSEGFKSYLNCCIKVCF
jgi:hypothetical protein